MPSLFPNQYSSHEEMMQAAYLLMVEKYAV
jgi:hypothetical protein